MNITNLTLKNIHSEIHMIRILSDSQVKLSNWTVTNTIGPILYIENSQINLYRSLMANITDHACNYPLLEFIKAKVDIILFTLSQVTLPILSGLSKPIINFRSECTISIDSFNASSFDTLLLSAEDKSTLILS